MADRITISNFGGIKEATITLNDINIFIGEQATGKSVVAMLVWFCRKVPIGMVEYWLTKNRPFETPEIYIENLFLKFFPLHNLPDQPWKICFDNGFFSFLIDGNKSASGNRINVVLPQKLPETTSEIKEILNNIPKNQPTHPEVFAFMTKIARSFNVKDDIFIPAGRSYFYQIKSNTFSYLSFQPQISPLILEFGYYFEQLAKEQFTNWQSAYPQFSNFGDFALQLILLFESIAKGKYHQDFNKEEFIIHNDNRKVSLFNASSGQQELLPLFHTLLDIINHPLEEHPGYYCYIEEPEAHLFPTGQAKVAKMIATTYNSHAGDHHFVITTHSPYFLSEYNNLIEAGIIAAQGNIDLAELHQIIPPNEILPPGKVSAFLFADGAVSSIMDEETGLILASAIDEISDSISNEFDQLLNLKYAHS